MSESLDGGWGWVVTFSSLTLNFLIGGICHSFGVFFLEFLDYFGGSNGKTQLLSSVVNGTVYLLGPIAGAALKRFGCRGVAMFGAVVSSAGLILSTLSMDLNVMILLYGGVVGVGCGLMFTPSIVIVNYYFNKYRAFSTGIAKCGSGIGTVAFPPLSMSANEGALLVSIIGISNTLSKIVIGKISDQSWVDCILINCVSLVIGGVTTCFVPYYRLFSILVTYSIIFGGVMGSFTTLNVIIAIELKGLERLPNAFGLLNLWIGIAILLGSPIAAVNKKNRMSGPLDGGWGWMVTFSSLMLNFLIDGICFSFGVFFMEFLVYFGGSNWKTQLLSSVVNGTTFLLGPIAGAALKRFGCRGVAIFGTVVSSAGLFLSTFSVDLNVMILLYGGVVGVGFGLMFTPSIVIINYYFSKRRAFATGIAMCGSGIGTFAFPPLSGFVPTSEKTSSSSSFYSVATTASQW
ncbi:monocarboxylate transporter 14-like [Pecten maximus]|uniref:monocarboxylate transporter 14-like n=1 Tax=Pecten maximus TaxID=6579 RepID=UPI00145871CE|nr:monocarboxylate transporter 14-like [Pecten maximus]